MTDRTVKLQLLVFAVITLTALGVLLARFGGLGQLVAPPYLIRVHFTHAGGIFPRAEVDLLGTPVGTVRDLSLAANGDIVATLTINHGVRLPTDTTAAAADKSAIGEQYVALTPHSNGGPFLTNDATIPTSRTSTPVPVEQLLGNLDALTASLPRDALATDLHELAQGFGGSTGNDLQQLLDQSDALTRASLDNLHDQIALINNTDTVLDTQSAEAPQIATLADQLAGLSGQIRTLDPTLAEVFTHGTHAGDQLAGLARENTPPLPDLIHDLTTVTDVATPRQAPLRKTLAVLPWGLQSLLDAVRYCGANDPRTAQPITSTCEYDTQGRPRYSLRFGFQLPEKPLISDPYDGCERGYEATHRFLPNGTPATGPGPLEQPDQPANNNARCTAPPTDPDTPNVRGAQNTQHP
jgi:phospholipid/cholesterol/gamma-HCH transport system substrate-binding protein